MTLHKAMLKFCLLGLILFISNPIISLDKSKQFDVLIKNTMIVDGLGNPAFRGSIAIKGEKIVAVGKVKGDALTVIDGSGLITCPGFVDPHSHADVSLIPPDKGILTYPLAENLIMQGITTFVGGNCAMSLAPAKDMTFGDWLSKVEQNGLSVNYAPLVGHNPIRIMVMGHDFRRNATFAEVKEMKKYVEEAMESGAFGFSTFGDPAPSHFADLEEIIELAKVVTKFGGLYVPHTAHIQWQWPTNDPELVNYDLYYGPPEDIWVGRYRGYIQAMEVSRRAKIPLHIAHLGIAFMIPQPHPEFLEEAVAKATLWLIDKAREEGIDVTFDVIGSAEGFQRAEYIIDAFYSERVGGLHWVQDIGKEEFKERIKTKEFRDRLRRVHDSCRLKFGMVHTKVDPYWYDCFKILMHKNKEYEGKTIGEIVSTKNSEPLETVFDLLSEDPEAKWAQIIDKRDTDIENAVFLKHPFAMPSTDTDVQPFKTPEGPWMPAPPAFGLYAHYIGHYIRGLSILSLEEGIKKATSQPAIRFGIKNRGTLKPGAFADIVMFDYNTIRSKGDFLNPVQRPDGIEYVFVNGQIVYKDKTHTGERPGKVLRKTN